MMENKCMARFGLSREWIPFFPVCWVRCWIRYIYPPPYSARFDRNYYTLYAQPETRFDLSCQTLPAMCGPHRFMVHRCCFFTLITLLVLSKYYNAQNTFMCVRSRTLWPDVNSFGCNLYILRARGSCAFGQTHRKRKRGKWFLNDWKWASGFDFTMQPENV